MLRQMIFTMTLVEDDSGIGKKIAKKLGVIFNGVQEGWGMIADAFLFTDPESETTFAARSEQEAEKNLRRVRAKFGFAY